MTAGRIPKSFIEQLLQRVDIVSLIDRRVPLKKSGRNYVACCPFHNEKTPSFNVNPARQFYHCFGCGAHGDAIRFLQEYEGLDFRDAVETLAREAGLQVPYEKLTPERRKQEEKRLSLYEVLAQSARFYRLQLRDHPAAEQAKRYLRERGLTPEIAKRYYLGFAPPGWDGLAEAFPPTQWQKISPLLEEAGLRIRRENRPGSYDRFRNRIMFPIRTPRGQVVGFGGRALEADQKPKYLNSPESSVFHKGELLYGLYEWLQQRQRQDSLIIVEGYMDAIALAQHGFSNAVATLGTAVTPEHIRRLYRHVDMLIFSFDGDAAGYKAAWKAAELLLPVIAAEQQARFLILPGGEDPDSLVRRHGSRRFARQLGQAPDLATFIIEQTVRSCPSPLSEQEGRRQFLAAITPWLKRAQGWHQSALLEQAAGLLELRPWQLARQLHLNVPLASNRAPLKAPRLAVPPVIGLPHRILHHLLACPALAERFFRPDDLDALKRLPLPGADILVWSLARLLEKHSPAAVRQALEEQGHGRLLQEMDAVPIASCEQAAETLSELLRQLLAQSILGQTDDIRQIIALKKGRSAAKKRRDEEN